MPRELIELSVEYISLVDKPANRKALVLKAVDTGMASHSVMKLDEEMQRAYGIVYGPGEVDAQGDFANAATIRKAADEFMLHKRMDKVDKQHDFNPLPDVYVAESWLLRKGDALFPTEAEGAWAVGVQIDNAEVWAQLKKGELAGLSLAGFGRGEERDGFPEEDTVEDIKKMLDEALAPIGERLSRLEKAQEGAQEAVEDGENENASDGGGGDEKALQKSLQAFLAKIEKRLDEMELSVLRKGRSESGGGSVSDDIPEGFL